MHTLAAAVEPGLCSLNPVINVVAFYSNKGQISLYRLDGTLVWTAPARKQVVAARLVWSPTGENLAVVYVDGLFQILYEATGKMAQVVANRNASAIVWQTGLTRPDVQFEVTPEFEWSQNLVLAVGTRNSTLEINLEGFLPIGALKFDDTPIQQVLVDDHQRVYTVLSQRGVYVVEAEFLSRFTSRQVDDIIIKPAKIQKLIDQVKTDWSKYIAQQTQFKTALDHLLTLENPVLCLYTTLITGFPDKASAAWIEDLHEAGFKRWVKSSTQYYQSVQQLLTEKMIPYMQYIIIYLGDMYLQGTFLDGNDALSQSRDLGSQLLTKLFGLCDQVNKEKALHQSFACALQAIYCQHLDRTLNVIDKETVAQADWFEAATYVKDYIDDPCLHTLPTDLNKEFTSQFAIVLDSIKTNLHQQLQYHHKKQWPELEMISMYKQQENVYIIALSQDDNEYHFIEWNPVSTATCTKLGPLVQVFFSLDKLITLSTDCLVVYDLYLQPLFKHSLSYEPKGCTVGNGKACVVSEDRMHFEVIDIVL